MGTPNCLPEAVAFELGSQGSGVTDEAKRPVAGGGNTLRDAACAILWPGEPTSAVRG